MSDLTIIFITANAMPARCVEFQHGHLRKAAGEFPIISISRQPMDVGTNLLDTEPKSYWNIYMQLLRGAKVATTPFVAMAEDDVLYTPEHFREFRPPADQVSYDRSRWSLFTWDPMYCLRQRLSNCALIAPRLLLIEALAERQAKWPQPPPQDLVGEVGRERVDRRLGVTVRTAVEWYCTNPIVHLNHPTGTDVGHHRRAHDGKFMVKKHGQIKAHDIPYWGKAVDIARVYESG